MKINSNDLFRISLISTGGKLNLIGFGDRTQKLWIKDHPKLKHPRTKTRGYRTRNRMAAILARDKPAPQDARTQNTEDAREVSGAAHTHRCPVPALVAMTGHDKSASCSCSPWPAAQPGPGQAREETTSQPPGHRARAAARAPFCRRRYGSNHVPSSFPFTTIPYTYVAWPLRIRLPPSCRSRPYGRCERTFFFFNFNTFLKSNIT
jgi:hypothetical protein